MPSERLRLLYAQFIADYIRDQLMANPRALYISIEDSNALVTYRFGRRHNMIITLCFYQVMDQVDHLLRPHGIICTEDMYAGHPVNNYCLFEYLPMPDPLEETNLRIHA